MNRLIIMQGIPGSGKSTFIDKMVHKKRIVIISSDDIRKDLIDNYLKEHFNIFEDNDYYHEDDLPQKYCKYPELNNLKGMVWEVFLGDLCFYLDKKIDIILDATFIEKWTRTDYILLAKKYGYRIEGITMKIPVKKCIENNDKRDRKVSLNVIYSMNERYEEFQLYEGFDKLTTIYKFL